MRAPDLSNWAAHNTQTLYTLGRTYWAAMARSGEPVGTPGKGPLEPAMSRWEYGRGLDESTPCCNYRVFLIYK